MSVAEPPALPLLASPDTERLALAVVARLLSRRAIPGLQMEISHDHGYHFRCLVMRVRERPGKAQVYAQLLRQRGSGYAIYGEPYFLTYRAAFFQPPAADTETRPAPGGMEAAYQIADSVAAWAERVMTLAGPPPDALPLTDADQAPLGRIARARREALESAEATVLVEEALSETGDEPAFVAGMRRCVAANFPRDANGRLALKTTIPLTPRRGGGEMSLSELALWYAAVGPEWRSDPQVIRVGWHWCTGERQDHRWEQTPWYWNPDVPPPPNEEERPEVAKTLHLQDAGHLLSALKFWNIETSGDVLDLLAGMERQEDHTATVQQAIRRASLWRFTDLVATERQRLETWRKAKKGRPPKMPAMKLITLPHQTWIRKTSLLLGAGEEGGGSRLSLEDTGTHARLPLTLWQRPIEMDLRRSGLWEGDAP